MNLLTTVTSLVQAGFTKEDILRFAAGTPSYGGPSAAQPPYPMPQAAPQAAPQPQPQPYAAPQPQPQPYAAPQEAPQAAPQPDMTQFMQELYRQGAQIDIPAPPQRGAYNVLGEALANYYSISGNQPGATNQ